MVDVRKVVTNRLKSLGKSKLWLAEQMRERPATVYDFLSGKAQVQSGKLERMLGALGMEIRAKE